MNTKPAISNQQDTRPTTTAATVPVVIHCWDEEAIPERDPSYQLPYDLDDAASNPPTLSGADAQTWREMCERRPLLACLLML